MLQFLIKKCATHPVRSKRPHFEKFGPCYLLAFALCLIMADLTRHLLNDAWGTHCDEHTQTIGNQKYTEVCYGTGFASMNGPDGHLNWLGIVFTIIFTWSGFILLFVAIFWGIDFHRKIRHQWRSVRGNRTPQVARENDRPLLPSV